MSSLRIRRKENCTKLIIYIGSDFGHPVFFIDVGKESDMDEKMVQACEEDENVEGQMEIEDFPEYLPDDFKEK